MSPDAALKAFYARASSDSEMKAALGTKAVAGAPARVDEGWPAAQPSPDSMPRMTYFMASSRIRRPGVLSVRVQADGWFWPGGGAAAKREAWTDRMLVLFDEAHWTHGGARCYSTVIPGADTPGGPDTPLRRRLDVRIEVSTL